MRNQNRFTTQVKKVRNRNTFVILAAGAGRRMACYGPKCLLEYKNETILDNQIKVIRLFDLNADIIVVTGFCANKVVNKMDHRVRLVENVRYEETNSIESIRLAINASIPSNLYLIHGDMIFSQASFCPDKSSPWIFVDDASRIGKGEVGVVVNKDNVSNLSYGLKEKWGQISYIPFEFFDLAKTVASQMNKNSSTFEFLNKMIKRGVKFKPYRNNKCVIKEIDSIRDL